MANNGADEETIQDFLLQINSLHHTFNEQNPITYQVLLAEFGTELNEDQKTWCRDEMRRLTIKQNEINKKILQQIDNEITRLPLSEKINESENKCIQLPLLEKLEEKFNENLVYRLPVGKT
jgi:dephospho-CoA kinase